MEVPSELITNIDSNNKNTNENHEKQEKRDKSISVEQVV